MKNGQGLLGRHPETTHHISAQMWCQLSNEQGFPHFYERVKVKKLAHEYRIRLASWNIGSLTGRLAELVDAIVRIKVSILYVLEIELEL